MVKYFSLIIKSARPAQVLKNLALFTGIVFSGWLFIPEKFLTVLWAIVVFSILTSSVYIFNDILDAPADKLHPLKRKRPIASGKLPIPVALFFTIFGFFTGLFLSVSISYFFFTTCLAYLVLHIFYTLYLKKLPIVEVLTIASGFILRVYAGAIAVDAHIDVWLLLCVVSFSLFLAVGKRRCELTLLTARNATKTRPVLFSYPEKLLDLYTSMFANTTWLTYAWFTFLQPPIIPEGRLLTLMADLPRALRTQKWLMATIPVVIYGVMRYLHLIYERGEGESPEKVLLSDKPLLATVILWGLMVVTIIYGLG